MAHKTITVIITISALGVSTAVLAFPVSAHTVDHNLNNQVLLSQNFNPGSSKQNSDGWGNRHLNGVIFKYLQDFLNLSKQEVKDAKLHRLTIEQILRSHGKDISELKEYMYEKEKLSLAKRIAKGEIKYEQAEQMLTRFKNRYQL